MTDRRSFILSMLALPPALTLANPSHAAESFGFRDLYLKDTVFSEMATELDGQEVEMSGFMAPPLKADAAFFVLTRMPMAVCPFCDDAADWPEDIVTVYTRGNITAAPFTSPISVAGVLRLGTYKDEELGFVSRVRLTEASFRRL